METSHRLEAEYLAALKQRQDELFSELEGDPGTEADVDPARFMSKYFLDAQGQPDREKTRTALAFGRLEFSGDELERMVEAVPGLAIRWCAERTIVGWEETIQSALEEEFRRIRRHCYCLCHCGHQGGTQA